MTLTTKWTLVYDIGASDYIAIKLSEIWTNHVEELDFRTGYVYTLSLDLVDLNQYRYVSDCEKLLINFPKYVEDLLGI